MVMGKKFQEMNVKRKNTRHLTFKDYERSTKIEIEIDKYEIHQRPTEMDQTEFTKMNHIDEEPPK
ncbi:19638_t:CDS:2 [Dentiscutata erythropus]|uniref:19638_t:CDS:1 n=1 Tax=Dentiscutata erythropus TaxID=1348616 RepID=A0A9N8ZSD4_9GLOM|nr:19638_t:CDS:2 [Dentiscutata erythropus]